ncbi:MFS transporter [Actinomadura kijaniata]|uniref:DHA1 family chloramphenicol resistance protein-like MFS transporter n=1 Tax=Actinomadura namibiensis TaxID=182080 RepID=A0A7W3LY70_ACTNM|nr:Cmx/CmrA family chloramphenicol efflux MFS transporter [Actinomadura namibiensis]MBA8956451.1 DHA1 family chloramphenicol resistance protein-like MFS transporter [Actinomadura namibiensis]
MPFVIHVLGLAVFALGTSEFMLSGLLPAIAADLHVSIPHAGLLTSSFAVGMVVGAPVLAAATRRLPRRSALLWFLVVFALCHVVGALTGDFTVLLATRVVSALAMAGFWAVASGTAVAMVAPGARARVMAVLVGGTSLACVAGVPAGAVLGQLWGWRAAFWAVAALTLLSVAAIAALLPARDAAPADAGLRAELRDLTRPPLLLSYTVNALVQGATFCTFTYLAPLVTETAGLAEGWVPVLLVLFGGGATLGITIGGRVTDARPRTVLVCGAVALTAGWALLALTAGNPVALVALVFVQGMLAFGLAPALTSRTFALAAGAPTLAGGFVTAAFNVGNTLGPWLGGLTIDAGWGFRSPVGVSLALMLGALAAIAAAREVSRV